MLHLLWFFLGEKNYVRTIRMIQSKLGEVSRGEAKEFGTSGHKCKGVFKSYSLKSEGVQYSLAIAKYYGMLQPILKQLFK